MIPLDYFKSLSLLEKKQHLQWIVGNIESENNQILMMCKKLLTCIEHPSEKLLLHIYQTIFNQITNIHIEEQKNMQEKYKTFIKNINNQENIDQEDAENILKEINNF